MKNNIQAILAAAFSLVIYNTSFAQDGLSMNDLNFNAYQYNSAFMAAGRSPLTTSLSTTNGGGIQNTGQLNFVAFSQMKMSDLAVGMKVNSKYFGLFRTSMLDFHVAKGIRITDKSRVMVGIGMGMQFSALRTGELNGSVDQRDPFVVNNAFPQYRFIAGLGVAYAYDERLKVGFSMPNFVKSESEFEPVNVANASYLFQINETFGVEPQVLAFGARSSGFAAEFSAKMDYSEKVWIRAGGRSNDSMLLGAGVHVGMLSIGYIYRNYYNIYEAIQPMNHSINIVFALPDVKAPRVMNVPKNQ